MPKTPAATVVSLEPIATGDITSKQAVELVRQYVDCHKRSGEALYGAFLTWTWRSLTERRYDEELRGWWEVMRMTAALLKERRQPSYAERVGSLCDLLYESIQFGLDESLEQVLGRVHVRRALHLLKLDWVERPRLRDQLGLKEANLSRLLSLLQARGLVERVQRGRIASFRVTRAGQEALKTLPEEPVRWVPSTLQLKVRFSPHHMSAATSRALTLQKRAVLQIYLRRAIEDCERAGEPLVLRSAPFRTFASYMDDLIVGGADYPGPSPEVTRGWSMLRSSWHARKDLPQRVLDVTAETNVLDGLARIESKAPAPSDAPERAPAPLVAHVSMNKAEYSGRRHRYAKSLQTQRQPAEVRRLVNG